VHVQSSRDRKSKGNKAPKEQQEITASKQELQEIKSRNKRWSQDQDMRPGARNKGSKYTSNKTHYSPTDPDARISVKPSKARKLNYLYNISVDTTAQVITDVQAYHAGKKDTKYLKDTTARLNRRLAREGLIWENVLADADYSRGFDCLRIIGLKKSEFYCLFQMRLFFGNAVRHHIGCSTQPSKNFILKSLYIVIGSIIEKILFYILDYIFYLALTLRICFATKVESKGLVPGIAAKAFGENDISPIFTYYKHFVLVVYDFVRNSSYIFKSLFMGYYG
jgi:hypothetical protein